MRDMSRSKTMKSAEKATNLAVGSAPSMQSMQDACSNARNTVRKKEKREKQDLLKEWERWHSREILSLES